jgi:hypothetical protein
MKAEVIREIVHSTFEARNGVTLKRYDGSGEIHTGERAMTHNPAEALRKLLVTTKLLQENSVRCVDFHHGWDLESNGLPGWLADCKKDIEAAEAALSPAPAGGDHMGFSPQEWNRLMAESPAVTPPPSPDVAGVVEMLREGAQSIDNDGTPAQVGPRSDELRAVATLLESLVGLVKDLDDALCAAQEKLQGNPLVLKWVIEIIGDARDRARTALTPKDAK